MCPCLRSVQYSFRKTLCSVVVIAAPSDVLGVALDLSEIIISPVFVPLSLLPSLSTWRLQPIENKSEANKAINVQDIDPADKDFQPLLYISVFEHREVSDLQGS